MTLHEIKLATEGLVKQTSKPAPEELAVLKAAVRPALMAEYPTTEDLWRGWLNATDSGWYPDTAKEAGKYARCWAIETKEEKICKAIDAAAWENVDAPGLELPEDDREFIVAYRGLHDTACEMRNAGELPVSFVEKMQARKSAIFKRYYANLRMLRGMLWEDVLEELEAAPELYSFEWVELEKDDGAEPFDSWLEKRTKDMDGIYLTPDVFKVSRGGFVPTGRKLCDEAHTKWTDDDFRG